MGNKINPVFRGCMMIRKKKKINIVLIGNIALDITAFLSIDNFRRIDEAESWAAKKTTVQVGGSVVNLGKAVTASGGNPCIVALVSEDILGELLISQLQEIGIDCSYIIPALDYINKTVLLVKEDGNKTMFYERATLNRDVLEAYNLEKLCEERYFHVSLNDWSTPLIKKLSKRIPLLHLSTDLHVDFEIEKLDIDLFRKMKIVFFSGAGGKDNELIIQQLLDIGPEIVICKKKENIYFE